MRLMALVAVTVVLVVSCGSDGVASPDATASSTAPADDGLYPDVVAVEVTPDDDGSWTVQATLSSPYDTAERYADAWRVLDEQGAVLGVRELAHDHAGEQPFTRSLAAVVIPGEVATITVEGRDQRNGWGGAVMSVTVPDR
jgi:hypothetical protein